MGTKGLNRLTLYHMTSLQHHGVIVPDCCLVINIASVIMMSQARGGWEWTQELNIKRRVTVHASELSVS